MFSSKTLFSAIFCILALATWFTDIVHGQNQTIQIEAKGRSYVGKKLVYDGRDMALLRRDGRISIIPVKNPRAIKTVSRSFKPYNAEMIRTKLLKEFGSKYQVSKTKNFVVVHPPGDYQTWAMPFEVLHQRFRNYFSSRGFSVDEPDFPLVAVVLRKRSEFDKFLRTYHEYSRNTLGYYSQKSNRIITYDPTGGRASKKDWAYQDTLIHEAVHQTAFNTGIHRRFGFTPLWVVEGLACMFESKGVYNNLFYPDQKDRVNKDRLANLKYYYKKNRVNGKLKRFIAGDKYFESDPAFAYAYSWGLTFFLAEKYPAKFYKFIRSDSNREEFREFTAKQRLRAFADAFGSDFSGLESRMEKFIVKL